MIKKGTQYHNYTSFLINRYVWLVETICKAGRITFEEINQKWVEKFEEDPIPLRTFHKWKIAVEEIFNLAIECERKGGYHYYIENADEIKRGGLRKNHHHALADAEACAAIAFKIL